MLQNIARRLSEEFKLTLQLSDAMRIALFTGCLHDLSNGGRDIGNQLALCWKSEAPSSECILRSSALPVLKKQGLCRNDGG